MLNTDKEKELSGIISALPEGKSFINITEKIIADERITDDEGIQLFEKASLGLSATDRVAWRLSVLAIVAGATGGRCRSRIRLRRQHAIFSSVGTSD